MSFSGKRLREYREKMGYSQNKFAELCGTTKGNISMYESEQRKPKAEMLEKMARVLMVEYDFIAGKTDTPIEEKPIDEILGGLTNKERELLEILRSLPTEKFEQAIEELMGVIEEHNKKTPQQ